MHWFNPISRHQHDRHIDSAHAASDPLPTTDAVESPQQHQVDDVAARIADQARTLIRSENGSGNIADALREAQAQVSTQFGTHGAELTAATTLAQTRLLSEQAVADTDQDPGTKREAARALLARNLISLTTDSPGISERADTVNLILNSRYTHELGHGMSTLGQILQIVDKDNTLGADQKSSLEQQIAHSDYAKSLGADKEKLLNDYPRLLDDLKTSPDDLNAVFAATLALYEINYGDGIQDLQGTALENTIGRQMGLTPNQPASSASDALYCGDQLKQVHAIADLMLKAGPGAKLTAKAAVFDPHDGKSGIGKTTLWRLDSADGKPQFVHQTGAGTALRTRVYDSSDDFANDGKAMGQGRMILAKDSEATVGDDGRIMAEQHDERRGIMGNIAHYSSYAIEGVALVGGGLLIASGFGAPVGGLMIAGAYASMMAGGTVMAKHGVDDLRDRKEHGEYVALGKQTAMDYAGIAGGVAMPLGKALQAGQSAAAAAEMTRVGNTAQAALIGTHAASGTAAVYSSGQVMGNWDQLSIQDKLTGSLNMAMFAAGVGQGVHHARLQSQGTASELYADMDGVLPDIVERARIEIPNAKNADYISALARVNPDQMGIAVRTADGRLYTAGDAEVPASIQSVSKVFAALLFGDTAGDDALWSRVGTEPSGRPFNSRELLDMDQGIPHNPAVNAGALVVADGLYGLWGQDYPIVLRDMLGKLSGNTKLAINKEVADSEYADAGNNRFLLTMMKEHGNVRNPVEGVLEAYCNQCAIEISAADLSRAAAVFANHGHDPVSGQQIVSPKLVGDLNTAMMMAGAYDEAGRFANQVGIPVKTGVGGLIAGWVPAGPHEGMTTATFSPPLNPAGNSAAGLAALTELSERYGLSLFRQPGNASSANLFSE